MKKLHKRILAHVFLISLSLSLSVPLIADPGATGSQDVGGGSNGVSLDGGVLELLVAGAVYLGYRKVRGFAAAKGK